MLKVNHSDAYRNQTTQRLRKKEFGMVNFSKNLGKNQPDSSLRTGSEPQASASIDIAIAEYSFFHIHQIKAWSGWSINQEDIDYTIDAPVYLNA